MGRRKIEIQPILHDRNRSVTFLKRKNGLFKKAYELGVLCSVDVLVVVFGTNGKLYEYCSSSNGNPNRILEKRVHHGGEREGRSPGDFNGDKSGGGGNDDDNDNDDLDLGEESDDAGGPSSRRPPAASSRTQSGRQSAYPTRGRGSGSNDLAMGHDSPDTTQGDNERNGPAPSASSSNPLGLGGNPDQNPLGAPNVPYHIAHLLAAAAAASASASGNYDPHRLASIYGSDPLLQSQQNNGNATSVQAAGTLGTSLAQLISTNPYLASQLLAPNLLGLGALGLNAGATQNQGGFGGTPGAFGTPGGGNGMSGGGGQGGAGVHPLYNTPLFQSFLQNQGQGNTNPQQNQNQNPNSFGSNLFPTSSPTPRDPPSRTVSGSSTGLRVDWPAPHSASSSNAYRPSTSATPDIPTPVRRDDARSPDSAHHSDVSMSSSQNRDRNADVSGGSGGSQSTQWLELLNAISSNGSGSGSSGGAGAGFVPSHNQSFGSTNGFGNASYGSGLGAGPYGGVAGGSTNPQSFQGINLSLLGIGGIGMGVPTLPTLPNLNLGSLNNHNAFAPSSSQHQGSTSAREGRSGNRKRSRGFEDELQHHDHHQRPEAQPDLEFTLPSMDQLMGAAGEGNDRRVKIEGGGLESMDGGGLGDGLDLDLDEDGRANKRGRSS